MGTLDAVVLRSTKRFVAYIRKNNWVGRENEAISLYAFGFLQRERRRRTLFHDATQIGIEVGAANAKRKGPKSQTRKDLVLWRRPGSNRWFPPRPRSEPWAIMEWKVRRTGFRSGSSNDKDIRWLKDHCKTHPETIGYAVWLNLGASPVEICVDRIDSNGMRRLAC